MPCRAVESCYMLKQGSQQFDAPAGCATHSLMGFAPHHSGLRHHQLAVIGISSNPRPTPSTPSLAPLFGQLAAVDNPLVSRSTKAPANLYVLQTQPTRAASINTSRLL